MATATTATATASAPITRLSLPPLTCTCTPFLSFFQYPNPFYFTYILIYISIMLVVTDGGEFSGSYWPWNQGPAIRYFGTLLLLRFLISILLFSFLIFCKIPFFFFLFGGFLLVYATVMKGGWVEHPLWEVPASVEFNCVFNSHQGYGNCQLLFFFFLNQSYLFILSPWVLY